MIVTLFAVVEPTISARDLADILPMISYHGFVEYSSFKFVVFLNMLFNPDLGLKNPNGLDSASDSSHVLVKGLRINDFAPILLCRF